MLFISQLGKNNFSDLHLGFYFFLRQKLHGINALLRYVGRIASVPNFYGQNAFESSQVIIISLNFLQGSCDYHNNLVYCALSLFIPFFLILFYALSRSMNGWNMLLPFHLVLHSRVYANMWMSI